MKNMHIETLLLLALINNDTLAVYEDGKYYEPDMKTLAALVDAIKRIDMDAQLEKEWEQYAQSLNNQTL